MTVGGSGGNTGTVTQINTSGLATGGPITNAGTVTVTAASAADMNAGTSNSVAVTPAVIGKGLSSSKAWALFDTTNTINAGYNVSSVTLNSTGRNTVNFTTSFDSAAYAVAFGLVWNQCNGFVIDASGGPGYQTASSFNTLVVTNANVVANPNQWMFTAFGFQS